MGIEYLEIRNQNRVLVGIIDTADSIIWETEYFGSGWFEIYIRLSEQTKSLLQIGNYVTRIDSDNIGIIEKIVVAYDRTKGRMISASGRFAKSILDRRLIFRLNGTSLSPVVSTGLVEVAARNLVNDHIISSAQTARNISFIKLGTLKGIQKKIIVDETTEDARKQTSFGNLLEYTDELLKEYRLGSYFSFSRASLDFLYTVYDGVDRSIGNAAGLLPIVFSQDNDNLTSTEYTHDATVKKNTALIGGAGEGSERFCTMVGVNASGMERREMFVDASSQSRTYDVQNGDKTETANYTDAVYSEMLKTAGQQELAKNKEIMSFSGAVDLTGTNLIFGKDYFVGDLISIQDIGLDIYQNARILSAVEVQDGNGYKIDIEYESES